MDGLDYDGMLFIGDGMATVERQATHARDIGARSGYRYMGH